MGDAAEVDDYLVTTLGVHDPVLEEILRASAAAGLPDIAVSATQGRLLQLLTEITGATRVLEVGTLGGYSAICLAHGLAPGGLVTTLERDPHHAAVARDNVARAGLADRVEVVVGPAADSLAALRAAGAGPFDLVFVDADKAGNPGYVEAALAMSRPGTVLVVDNVVRDGTVLDETGGDPSVIGTRQVLADLGRHPRLTATAIQTVGAKGWDGFAIAHVH